MSKLLYRVEDAYGRLYVRQFEVIRRTPCGAWINDGVKDRFILDGARKRYATEDVESAKTSFVARKTRQLAILTAQAENVRRSLTEARDMEQFGQTLIDSGIKTDHIGMEWCDMCDGVGLMEGWNHRDGNPCPKCKGSAKVEMTHARFVDESAK